MANEKGGFARVWGLLSLAYPNYGKDGNASALAETMRLYQRLLDDLPLDALEQAVLRHIATSKWFPTVAELRSAAGEIVHPSAAEQTALEAWGDVLETFVSGEYIFDVFLKRLPTFRNPLTQAAVTALGGWGYLGQSDNAVADRARFVEVYNQLQARQRTEQQLPPALRVPSALAAARRGATLAGPEKSSPALPDPTRVAGLLVATAAHVTAADRAPHFADLTNRGECI